MIRELSMWEYWGMANEREMTVAEETAGRCGRLQAQLMILENYLTNLSKRDDIPGGVKAGAEYYMSEIAKMRDAGDLG